MNKKLWGFLALFFAFLDLIYTPLKSKFATHVGELDFRLGILDICISLTNKAHIIGFGILAMLLLNYLSDSKSKYLKTFIWVVAFGFCIEISQIFFVDGHFRLRDIISYAVGTLIAFILYELLIEKNLNATNKKFALTTLIMIVAQIIIVMVVYYLFKEISIFIGGENLRKYL